MQLNDALVEYLAFRKAQNFAPATLVSEKRTLRQLMEVNGNILVRNISERSVERLYAKYNWQPSTYNRVRTQLASFFKWARSRGHMARDNDPLANFRQARVVQPDVLFVPQERFAELLDVAEKRSPRNRALVAIGLYAFLRGGEASALRWQDIDLDEDYISLHRVKTYDKDRMPICAELHEELARWKYAYGVAVQEIPHLDWHVIPPFRAPGFKRGADGLLHLATRAELIPTRRLTIPHYPIQLALGDMGYATLDEGGHTLRRSGGYALYQRLSHLGHDRAGRIVQSMYGHKSFQTTEKYLRLSLERKARDDILRGQRMFDEAEGKVIHLGEDRAGDIRLRQV